MDQIDAFPEHISTTVMPVTLPEKPDALEYAARQGHVRACILYQEPNTKRVFVLFCKDNWHQKRRWWIILRVPFGGQARERIQARRCLVGENLQRNVEKSRSTPEKYRQEDGVHLQQHVFCEKRLYVWLSNDALSSNGVGTPHGVPDPGWNPLHLVDGAKDNVWFGHYPRNDAPQLMENGFNLGDFRQRKRFDQKAYKLPPPTPAHVPAETNKRPLEQQPKPLSKKKRVIITPIIRPSVPSVMIIKPSTALSTPQPITTSQILLPDPPESDNISSFYQIHLWSRQTTSQILLPDPPEQTTSQILLPDPPEQTTSQILLPDPPVVETTSQILLPDPPSKQTTSQILLPDPPVVETLEPTLTDDSSIDQIMSSVFGDYLPQGIPSAHSQEPQVLDTVPSLFDESNDLISFLDHFEAGLAIEQQETPMDLTMPRMKKK
ncbi:uncharacterized protein TNCV_2162401 [Trichonephila clavipes]|nr:uncharacterized protein TNCV_2162401 [Trichonephila clavipes]